MEVWWLNYHHLFPLFSRQLDHKRSLAQLHVNTPQYFDQFRLGRITRDTNENDVNSFSQFSDFHIHPVIRLYLIKYTRV